MYVGNRGRLWLKVGTFEGKENGVVVKLVAEIDNGGVIVKRGVS